MKIVSFNDVKQNMNSSDRAPLINVLASDKFNQTNIPGSINIPADGPGFPQLVEQRVGGKDKPVTLYCASSECPASRNAAKKLEDAGFTNVSCFEGGFREWNEKSNAQRAA